MHWRIELEITQTFKTCMKTDIYSDILVIKWGPTYHLKNFSFPHLFLIIKSGSPAQLLFN